MSERRPPTTLTCDEVRALAAGFVLDALEHDEMASVREHLATCDQPHPEIAELGSALPVLDASVPVVEPPAALKGRIMDAAAAEIAGRTALVAAVPTTAVPAAVPAPEAPPTLIPSAAERADRDRRRTSPAAWAMRIAAVLVIGGLIGWNLLLRNQLDAAQQYQHDVAAVIDIASQSGSLTAVLRPDRGSVPNGLAAVAADGQLAMAMHDLAPTIGGTVYEAWVVGSDGVPVALGSFTVGSGGTAYFEANGLPSQAGIVLALTHEAGPGATVPTPPLVVSGTTTSTS